MNSHINARTTPYARASMVARREAGVPICEIAAAFSVSPRTVFKWLARYRCEGEAGLANRSSRPRRSPGAPSPAGRRADRSLSAGGDLISPAGKIGRRTRHGPEC